MFSPRADFSELSKSAPGKLRVSSIKHKAFVDVNEDGTEAAAVTGKEHRTLFDIDIFDLSCYSFFFILIFLWNSNSNNLLIWFYLGANVVNYNLEYVLTNIKTVKFHACHPFLFIIKKEKDIIFMGRLSNPNA